MPMRLCCIFWAAALLAQTQEVRNPRTSAMDVAAGAKTFRSHCTPCHGLNGEGGRGPNLAAGVLFHGSSDSDLLNNISNGIPGTEMPGLSYNEDRVWQVVAYVRSLNEAYRAKVAGDRMEGQKVFRAKGCPQCHRINGEGGRLGPDLTNIGKTRAPAHLRQAVIEPNADVRQRYWVVRATSRDGKTYNGFLMNEDTYSVQLIDFEEQLRSLEKAELKEYKVEKPSTMPDYKDALAETELEDLVAYLSSLRPEGGAR